MVIKIYKQNHKTCLAKDTDKLTIKLKSKYYTLAGILLSACGPRDQAGVDNSELQDSTSTDTTAFITLTENTDYTSDTEFKEIISTNQTIFKSIGQVYDQNVSDNDEIIVNTSEDILTTPVVSGFEDITFQISEDLDGIDSQFYVDLVNFSNFKTISFTQTELSSQVPQVNVINAHGSLSFNDKFSEIFITSVSEEDLSIETNTDSVIQIFGEGKNITLDGNGGSINVSTSSSGSIEIS